VNQNPPKNEPPQMVGAGGKWPVSNEIIDPKVVRQHNELYCGPACAEMLLKDRGITNIDQNAIADRSGVPAITKYLARAINNLVPEGSVRWQGGPISIPGATDSQVFEVLNTTGSYAAVFKETGARIGHLVVVDGVDKAGRVMIRYPWEGTKYTMKKEDFLNYWNTEAIYGRKL